MATLYITHDAFLEHDTGEWHPERADRIRAIDRVLSGETFKISIASKHRRRRASRSCARTAETYFDFIERAQPKLEIVPLDDGDTVMSPKGWEKHMRSAEKPHPGRR